MKPETILKKAILKRLQRGIVGARMILLVVGGDDLEFDVGDMINAIWKVRKKRK